MAFSEAEKVKLRRWLGFAPIFRQQDTRLESAMVSIQSKADGGDQPDSSTEDQIRIYLAKLDGIEERWEALYVQMQVSKADEVELNAPRAIAALKSIGRMYVGHISDCLGTRPRRDVFTPPRPLAAGEGTFPGLVG